MFRCGVQVIGVVLIGVVCSGNAMTRVARVRAREIRRGVFALLGATLRWIGSVGCLIDFLGWGSPKACW